MFSSDYLTDGKIDDMPREGESLLIRMWCVCNIEGSCPADPEALSRKTRCELAYVLHHVLHCAKFFELRDGRYYSARLEREKLISKARTQAAVTRWNHNQMGDLHSVLHDAKEDANTHALRSRSREAEISSKASPKIQERAVQMPKDFEPNEAHRALATKLGVDLAGEFEAFRDHHLAKGSRFKVWDFALNTWLRKAKQYGGNNGKQDFGSKVSRAVREICGADGDAD